jgi:CNT family concentrative nucleoside transporter
VVFVIIAWFLSENRPKTNFKNIIIGIIIQLVVAFILLRLPLFRNFFLSLNNIILSLEKSTTAGTSIVFG